MSKKKKKQQLNEFIGLGGMVSIPAIHDINSKSVRSPKLKDVVEEIYGQQDEELDVKGFLKEVGQYNTFGEMIYRDGNLRELAEKLSKLTSTASTHILESADWFDKITLNKNVKHLKTLSSDFTKTANEAQSLQERLTDLYESIGMVLGKYYDIQDGCDKSSKKGLKKHELEERDENYQKFFRAAMKKWGISSPEELNGRDKKDFYNYIDRNWSAEKETD